MNATFSTDTLDDTYVVPTACVLADSEEKDITRLYWLYFRVLMTEMWGEK